MSTSESGSIFEHKEQPTLALEAPTKDVIEEDDIQTVVVDGNPVRMDKLGPLVINTDGTLARINNWHEMTELEQQKTLRVLGRRNKQRLAKLQEEAGLDAIEKIGSFCQNATTRRRIFEAFYGGFDSSLDEAALDLLRARRKVAEQLGFRSYADLEMAPMAVGDEATARRWMDQCWQEAQPTMSKAVKKMKDVSSRGGSKGLSHVDQMFWRAHVAREIDTWRLSEFLPADKCLPSLLNLVGKAYSVTFREVDGANLLTRLLSGWHRSVKVYEVTDGPPSAVKKAGRGKLGYVYLDLYRRMSFLGRPAVELAGALRLCPGHAYLSCNLPGVGLGQGSKLLHPEELVGITHELGHAVHILCHTGSPQEFDDLPLDVLELPSTLVETIALHPESMTQYAQHRDNGSLPPGDLLRSCQRDSHFFVRVLQNCSVSLGLHAEDFDPFKKTAADLREHAISLWQRYSLVEADPAFTPLGGDAGLNVGHGANHVAYLLCYLRVANILQKKGSRKDAARWLQPEFAGLLRSQLLDQNFPSERMAAVQPTLGKQGRELPPHPLPQLPSSTLLLFQQLAQ
ncbi:Oligopeptidase A [Durusdinium trenchii]|uniref:Oligopeptidase A n=2 Tax=Durusdinium trenchii TaxID=1381693 RepID=A0ABP0JMK0_9DINO